MKLLCITLFVAVTTCVHIAKAQKESCVQRALLVHLGTCPARGTPCRDTCGDGKVIADLETERTCDEYRDCCFRSGECIQLSSSNSDKNLDDNDDDDDFGDDRDDDDDDDFNDRDRDDDEDEKRHIKDDKYPTTEEVDEFKEEYKGHFGDSTPITCNTNRFPYNCRRESYTSNNLKCLVNIPYCMRVPCFAAVSQHEVENNMIACTANPGCCYDEELSLYRRHFGQRVLPDVPVCHFAVRNDVFQKEARRYEETFGGWNPMLTKCLIESLKEDIFVDTAGCYTVTVIEYFGLRAKQAGWKGIGPLDCYLIGGCFRPGRGCVYPFDPSRGIELKPYNPYERPSSAHAEYTSDGYKTHNKYPCQAFRNLQDPYSFLTTYHQCLSSGCILDASAQDLYLKHLWNVSLALGPRGRDPFWKSVMSYEIRADNFLDELEKYKELYNEPEYDSPLVPLDIHLPNLPPIMPHLQFNTASFRRSLQGPISSLSSSYGKRCAFEKPQVQNFPPLQGSFTDCCEKPLCYFSAAKITQEQLYSELTYYYSPWSAWSKCSASCGGGKYRRVRHCISHNEVTPYNDCKGQEEDRDCNTIPCPYWGQWGGYGACSVTCGGGVKARRRRCSGRSCYGPATETAACGQWKCEPATAWSQWTSCSTSCGKGYQARTRRCLGDCPKDFKASHTRICFMYCGSIVWGPWSKCNEETCTMERAASCKNGQSPGYCQEKVPASAKASCTRNPCYCKQYPSACRQSTLYRPQVPFRPYQAPRNPVQMAPRVGAYPRYLRG